MSFVLAGLAAVVAINQLISAEWRDHGIFAVVAVVIALVVLLVASLTASLVAIHLRSFHWIAGSLALFLCTVYVAGWLLFGIIFFDGSGLISSLTARGVPA